MGNICKATTLGIVDTYERVDIKQFRKLQVFNGEKNVDEIIGVGGFAVVYRVRKIGDDTTDYAMKTMNKILVSQNKNIQPTLSEMLILRDIQHPFLIDMRWAFNDTTHLYLIMKELKGKDLRFHINHFKIREDQALRAKQLELDMKLLTLENRDCSSNINNSNIDEPKKKPSLELSSFNENQARYFLAQVCLALNYLHSKQIIHRDIKPENILFENDGYLRITDMGIAKIFRSNNNTDTSGTPGYMAPEVLCRQNHNYAVDYYAVGVIAFELMFNRRPYENEDKNDKKDVNYRNELIKNILQYQICVQPYNKESFGTTEEKEIDHQKYSIVTAPPKWSFNGIDFINKRKPTERLGYYDINEVINHPWFQGINFEALLQKKYTQFSFNKTHMLRSEKRAKVMEYLEEQVSKIDSKIIACKRQRQLEEEKLKRDILNGRTSQLSSSEDDNGNENEEEDDSNYNHNIRQANRFNYSTRMNNFNAKGQYNLKQQDAEQIRIQEQEQMRRKEKEIIGDSQISPENMEILRSTQQFFKNYYFDRDRYNYELKYLEEKRHKSIQSGKKLTNDDNNIIFAHTNSYSDAQKKSNSNNILNQQQQFQQQQQRILQQQYLQQSQLYEQQQQQQKLPPLTPLAFPDIVLLPEEMSPNINNNNLNNITSVNQYSISKSFSRTSMQMPSGHKSSFANVNINPNPPFSSSLNRTSVSTATPQTNGSFNRPNSSFILNESVVKLDRSIDQPNNSSMLQPDISIKMAAKLQGQDQQQQQNKQIFNSSINSFAQANQFQVK